MKFSLLLISALMALGTGAQALLSSSIDTLVEGAGYIVVARVLAVDVIGIDGQAINSSKTLVRRDSSIRLHIIVDQQAILKGDRTKSPKELIVLYRNSPISVSTVGGIKNYMGSRKFIFLLNSTGSTLSADYESVRDISERESIVKLVKQGPAKRRKPSRQDARRIQ